MKTGMELPLIGLVVIAVCLALWQAWSGMQVDMSVGALNATIAGQATPEPVLIANQWLLTGAGVVTLAAVLIGGGYALWRWWQKRERREAKNWKQGPNANWGRQPAGPRIPSEAELMRMALLQQMSGQRMTARPTITREGEDEPEITF